MSDSKQEVVVQKKQQKDPNKPANEIRVRERRSHLAYVRAAEHLLQTYDEIIISGLGNCTEPVYD
jgi:hypothetical protein